MWRMVKKMPEYSMSAMMLDRRENMLNMLILGRVVRVPGCTFHTLFELLINGQIRAIDAAKQEVKGGENVISGLMFADSFVGISGTAEWLQKRL